MENGDYCIYVSETSSTIGMRPYQMTIIFILVLGSHHGHSQVIRFDSLERLPFYEHEIYPKEIIYQRHLQRLESRREMIKKQLDRAIEIHHWDDDRSKDRINLLKRHFRTYDERIAAWKEKLDSLKSGQEPIQNKKSLPENPD
jgi:hypothetical protein